MICPSCGHEFRIINPSRLLTPRELETVEYLFAGYSKNKEIAAKMQTTEQVVKNRFRNIFHKLGLRRRVDLVQFDINELKLKEQ